MLQTWEVGKKKIFCQGKHDKNQVSFNTQRTQNNFREIRNHKQDIFL